MPTEVLVDEGKGVEGGPGENPDNPGNVLEPTPAPVDASTPTRSQVLGTHTYLYKDIHYYPNFKQKIREPVPSGP